MSDFLNSLDPRINRLQIPAEFGTAYPAKDDKDQFITYEVFVQPKPGKTYQHEGIVHAPTIEMAFLFAKEQFSRRGISCSGVWVIKTDEVQVSPFTENGEDIYHYINDEITAAGSQSTASEYVIFHLKKRGKQHQAVGKVEAGSFEEALLKSKSLFASETPTLNIWVAKEDSFMKIEGEEFADIWETLPDKKYRDAVDYRATDKIKKFKREQNA